MGIEEQLSRIKTKADLRKWVEDLPDDIQGLVLYKKIEDDDRTVYSFHEIGPITLSDSLWLARSYEHYLFGLADES